MTESKDLIGTLETWFTGCRIAFEDNINGGSYVTDRKLLIHILRGQHHMALQLTNLTAGLSTLGTDFNALASSVQALIAKHTDPADQQAIDALVPQVTNISTQVAALTKSINDVLTPPAPPPAG